MPLTPTVAALGPGLYAGTAGIALFLAELFVRTKLKDVRLTAAGAIQQSLSRVDDVAPRQRRSFYSGLVGIAYSAANVGTRIGDEQLIEQGVQLALRAIETRDGDNLLDVINGNAGSIPPLLWLSTLPGGESLGASALALADELAAASIRDDRTWRWDNDRACGHGMGPKPLCGYAHGASGMGLALIEAGVHHGRDELVDGGLAAFRYEDGLFDGEHQNWPDLREYDADGAEETPAPRVAYMVAWCHGAAGIGLARLRAFHLLAERRSELRLGVTRALESTSAQLNRIGPEIDASPCHGRAGLAETLLYATEVLGVATHADYVHAMWRHFLKARKAEAPWPCGVASGINNPSLMLGHAGIGHGILRADDTVSTPSALIVTSDNRQ